MFVCVFAYVRERAPAPAYMQAHTIISISNQNIFLSLSKKSPAAENPPAGSARHKRSNEAPGKVYCSRASVQRLPGRTRDRENWILAQRELDLLSCCVNRPVIKCRSSLLLNYDNVVAAREARERGLPGRQQQLASATYYNVSMEKKE